MKGGGQGRGVVCSNQIKDSSPSRGREGKEISVLCLNLGTKVEVVKLGNLRKR